MNDKYCYKFKYTCDGTDIEYAFDADITMTELLQHFRYFLKSCSWTDDVIKKYLGDDDV